MSKRAKIILFSALGVFVVAAIAVTTVVLVIHQNHKNDVAEADRVAAAYVDDVASYREEQAEVILDSAENDGDPEATLEVIAEAADEAPTLGDAPEYGRENSDDYADASAVGDRLQADLETLTAAVESVTTVGDFLDAASTALDRNAPIDLLGAGPFPDGSHVRNVVIPGVQGTKDAFEAVDVPVGFEEAAELTSAALQHVIDNLNQMAVSLDGGQSFSFQFADQYAAAETAVDDAVGSAEDQIKALIEAFGAGDELDAPDDSGDSGEDADEPAEDEDAA
jgi:hypothetical protein